MPRTATGAIVIGGVKRRAVLNRGEVQRQYFPFALAKKLAEFPL